MKSKILKQGALALTILLSFQSCGISDESDLYGMNESRMSSSQGDSPSLDSDQSSLTVGTSNIVVTGNCDVGNFTRYYFDVSFQNNGSTAFQTSTFDNRCVGGRYSLSASPSALQISSGANGIIQIKIVANNTIESQAVSLTVTSEGGGTSGGTTGGTTCQPVLNKVVGPSGYILLSAAAARVNINGGCSNGVYGLGNNPGWAVFRNGTLLPDPNRAISSDQQYMSESLWKICETKAQCPN